MKTIPGIILSTVGLILLSSICSQPAFSGGEPESFNLEQVAQGIFLHEGVHVEFTHPQHDDIANIGFIVGEDCIAVVDTGGSITIGQQLLASLREISSLPVCYVINTHIHFDHILGNQAFMQERPKFAGHSQLADAAEENRNFFLEQFKDDLGSAPDGKSIIGPDILVNNTLELDLGNRLIRLTAHQTAHSGNDLTVFDLQTKTLWTGDLVNKDRIPALDGKLKGWLAVLEKLQTQDINLVIPGHGTPGNDVTQILAKEKAYLEMLLTDTRAAIAKGLFLEDAIQIIGKQEKQEWLLHEQHHSRNITKAFIELEWE